MTTTLRLAKDLERSIRLGAPWVYRDALVRDGLPRQPAVVDLQDRNGRFVGRGVYDPSSPIAVRLVTLDPAEPVDPALVRRRIAAAVAARAGAFDPATTDAWRCVNGEGDRLPGIVADVYGRVAVVRLEGPAATLWREATVAGLIEALTVEQVVLRQRGGRAELLHGPPPPESVVIQENGVQFRVDVLKGQKTGFFLDQRDNRRAIHPYCAATVVANLFGYTGGFSVHAALAGASKVVTVDSAGAALNTARDNFLRNGLDPNAHEFVEADAFAWLAAEADAGRRYGLVIADPPSFAPSARSLGPALEAYRRLIHAALAITASDGVVALGSCSSHVTAERFLEVVARAAADADQTLRILAVHGQPADHPSLPAWPEGRYLKFVLARVGS